MIYQHIFHACFLVSSSDQTETILFDPFLNSRMSAFTNCVDDIIFNETNISESNFTAVFISHTHYDHYELESLSKLKKSTPIYLYAHNKIYHNYISRLGFTKVYSLSKGETVSFNKFRVTCLPNINDKFECAFHITDGQESIINVVDIQYSPQEAKEIISQYGRPNLLIFPFQVLRELSLSINFKHYSTDYELNQYQEKFNVIKEFEPTWVIPGSCQFKFSDEEWKNEVYFFKSRHDFVLDLKNKLPGIKSQIATSGVLFELTSTNLIKLNSTVPILKPIVQTIKSFDYHFTYGKQAPEIKLAKTIEDVTHKRAEIEKLITFDFKVYIFKLLKLKYFLNEEILSSKIWRITIYYSQNEVIHYDFDLFLKTLNIHTKSEIPAELETSVVGSVLLNIMSGENHLLDLVRFGNLKISGLVDDSLLREEYKKNFFVTFLFLNFEAIYFEKIIKQANPSIS